jgi:hypothetical protein
MKVPNQEVVSSRWIFASAQDLRGLSCEPMRAWSSLIAVIAMRAVVYRTTDGMAHIHTNHQA